MQLQTSPKHVDDGESHREDHVQDHRNVRHDSEHTSNATPTDLNPTSTISIAHEEHHHQTAATKSVTTTAIADVSRVQQHDTLATNQGKLQERTASSSRHASEMPRNEEQVIARAVAASSSSPGPNPGSKSRVTMTAETVFPVDSDEQSAGFTAWIQGLYTSVLWGGSNETNQPSESRNMFSFVRGDVVVIPGILGTYLKDRVTNKREWLTVEKLMNMAPCEIGLSLHGAEVDPYSSISSSSSAPERVVVEEVFEKFGPINVCGKLMQELESLCKERTDVRLHKIGYDWRQDMTEVADKLLSQLETIYENNGHKKITYIAHSLGGLIGMNLLNRRPEIFRGIVLVGSPMKSVPITLWAFKRGFPVLPNTSLFDRDFMFLMRSTYIFLPLDGKGLVDGNGNDIIIDYLDPQAWFKYGFVPQRFCEFSDDDDEDEEEDNQSLEDYSSDEESLDNSNDISRSASQEYRRKDMDDMKDRGSPTISAHDSDIVKDVEISAKTLSEEMGDFETRSCCSCCCETVDKDELDPNMTIDPERFELARKWGAISYNLPSDNDSMDIASSGLNTMAQNTIPPASNGVKVANNTISNPSTPPSSKKVQQQSQYTINKKTGKLELRPTRAQVIKYLTRTLDNARAFRLSLVHNPERQYPPICTVVGKKFPTMNKFRASISVVDSNTDVASSSKSSMPSTGLSFSMDPFASLKTPAIVPASGLSLKLNPFDTPTAASIASFFGMKIPPSLAPSAAAAAAAATAASAAAQVSSTATGSTSSSFAGAVAVGSEALTHGYTKLSVQTSETGSSMNGKTIGMTVSHTMPFDNENLLDTQGNLTTNELFIDGNEGECITELDVAEEANQKLGSRFSLSGQGSRDVISTPTKSSCRFRCSIHNGTHSSRGRHCTRCRLAGCELDATSQCHVALLRRGSKDLHKSMLFSPDAEQGRSSNRSFNKSPQTPRNREKWEKEVERKKHRQRNNRQRRVNSTKAERKVDILWPKEVVPGDGIVSYEMTKLPQGYRYTEILSSFGHASIMNDLAAIRAALSKFDYSDL